jgi:hypothetical protein
MPVDDPFTLRQVDQARTDYAIIETELEAIHARLAQMPSKQRYLAGSAFRVGFHRFAYIRVRPQTRHPPYLDNGRTA